MGLGRIQRNQQISSWSQATTHLCDVPGEDWALITGRSEGIVAPPSLPLTGEALQDEMGYLELGTRTEEWRRGHYKDYTCTLLYRIQFNQEFDKLIGWLNPVVWIRDRRNGSDQSVKRVPVFIVIPRFDVVCFNLVQVRMVLNNFFRGREDLYLLQIDATKLGEELIYEAAEDTYFPHFYGPDRSYRPLSLDVVSKAEKLELKNAEFTCSLLDQA
ncbi:hypothetical protein B296_00000737 [Ensete ventricosum]|uniref:Uncharacterized protein n=1 Tax=Ensete ventricosum TaxID=4639 RepID=A0A427BCG0_ENSVE|nr:hypothetical protein B296_00000737 [Ensete ventricosum]